MFSAGPDGTGSRPSGRPRRESWVAIRGRWSCTRTTRRLPRPPLPAAHRGAVRAHRALDQASATPATSTGARSPGTTSSPSTARDAELAHRRSARCRPHLQLADLRDPRRQGQRRRSTATRRKTASGVDLQQAARAQPRTAERRPPHGQPLPQAHPLRQPRRRCSTTPAGARASWTCLRSTRRSTTPTGCSRSSSTTASTTRPRRRRRRRGTDPTGALASLDARPDPFSSYRAGFEVRTDAPVPARADVPPLPGRAGRRARLPGALHRLHLLGRRRPDRRAATRSTPSCARSPRPATAAATAATTSAACRRSSSSTPSRSCRTPSRRSIRESLENLPVGLDGGAYHWTDLHGEGIPGILTEQAGAWFYKRNLSPIPAELPDGREQVTARFAPLETVALKPERRPRRRRRVHGPGRRRPARRRASWTGPTPGLYEHDDAEGWQPFRPFTSRLNRDLRDPNLRFVDLDGDGHADVLDHRGRRLRLAPLARRGRLRPGPPRRHRRSTRRRARASSSPTARSRSTSPTCPATA